MREYILNILPRIRQYSKTLDKIENFVDKPWVILDEYNNQQKFIFRRNGELLMSLNGQVTIGKWKYIAEANSLLIDRITDKILLNQDFVDPAVMILKMDGRLDKPFLLANEKLIPDLDIGRYLHELYYSKNSISLIQLDGGGALEVHTLSQGKHKKVTIDGNDVPNGELKLADKPGYIKIANSRIIEEMIWVDYKLNGENFQILLPSGSYFVNAGYHIMRNGQPLPDGKYRIGFFEHIHVKNGIIRKITTF
jgi:hypothetical protein